MSVPEDFQTRIEVETTPLRPGASGEIYFIKGKEDRDLEILEQWRAGNLRKLGSLVFTNNLVDPEETVTLRNWPILVGFLYPDSVITLRSAFDWKPTAHKKDHWPQIYLSGPPTTERSARGLTVTHYKGVGRHADDIAFLGCWVAGPVRKWLENLRRFRADRVLGVEGVTHKLEAVYREEGASALEKLCHDALKIAPHVDRLDEFEILRKVVTNIVERDRIQKERLERLAAMGPPEPMYADMAITGALVAAASQLESRAPIHRASSEELREGVDTLEADCLVRIVHAIRQRNAVYGALPTRPLRLGSEKCCPSALSAQAFMSALSESLAQLHRRRRRGPELGDGPDPKAWHSGKPGSIIAECHGLASMIGDPFHRAMYLFLLVWMAEPDPLYGSALAIMAMNAEMRAHGLTGVPVPPSLMGEIEEQVAEARDRNDPSSLVRTMDFCQKVAGECARQAHQRAASEFHSTPAERLRKIWDTTFPYGGDRGPRFGMPREPVGEVAAAGQIPLSEGEADDGQEHRGGK